ncbi:hypothetical protein ACFYYB_41140 [Streptomyces sp. NPDC002886]|uniref:hypothetical protein n=1 Tax=Streptomyces sp. NPDC002886 TaxID=3364667 RepID=UPI00368F026B
MNTSGNATPARARWDDGVSRSRTSMVWAVWGLGAAFVIGSVILLVGAFTADSMAGESWQPAGVLGAIGLSLGVVFVICGVLARALVSKQAHP